MQRKGAFQRTPLAKCCCFMAFSSKHTGMSRLGLHFNVCLSLQHQTDPTITTDIATPRARPWRKRRPGRLSRLKHGLAFVGKSKLDTWHSSINDESRSRGRNSSNRQRERHSRYDSMAQALISHAGSRHRAGLALPPVLSPAFCTVAAAFSAYGVRELIREKQ